MLTQCRIHLRDLNVNGNWNYGGKYLTVNRFCYLTLFPPLHMGNFPQRPVQPCPRRQSITRRVSCRACKAGGKQGHFNFPKGRRYTSSLSSDNNNPFYCFLTVAAVERNATVYFSVLIACIDCTLNGQQLNNAAID